MRASMEERFKTMEARFATVDGRATDFYQYDFLNQVSSDHPTFQAMLIHIYSLSSEANSLARIYQYTISRADTTLHPMMKHDGS